MRRKTTPPPSPRPVAPDLVPMQAGLTRLLTVLRSSRMGLLVLALAVGAGAGGAAIAFRWLIKVFTIALSGHADYAGLGHVANPYVPGLGRWFVIFAPEVAGLLYGPLVHFFARRARRRRLHVLAPLPAALREYARLLPDQPDRLLRRSLRAHPLHRCESPV